MSLLDDARKVLESNDIDGKSTRGSPGLYPHRWLWDSCFIALGYMHFDPARAKREILSLLESRWENGMIPHIIFNPGAEGYFPSAERWGIPGGRETSGITQPPMPAIVAWEIYRKDGDVGFLEMAFPYLEEYHDYLHRERGGDLLFIIHPWESGLDNSPVFDEALDRVNITHPPELERIDDKLVAPSQRPTKRHYEKYLRLVDEFREMGYEISRIRNDGSFIFYDVLFNSVWCEANRCMQLIAGEIGKDGEKFGKWHDETVASMKRLMKRGLFYCMDGRRRNLVVRKSCEIFIPLFAGLYSEEDAKGVLEEIGSFTLSHPVCSFDPSSLDFERSRYWRGPVWVNINWFLVRGLIRYGYGELAAEIAQKTVRLVRDSGFMEYYDPEDGRGYGSSGFSWTAALTIDLIKSCLS